MGHAEHTGKTSIGGTAQSDEGAVIHTPDEADVAMMNEFPPPAERQVTLENRHRRHEHLRWAHQHMQEFLPTQRVRRGSGAVSVFPRADRDSSGIRFRDMAGNWTTLDQQLIRLQTDAFLLIKDSSIVCEHYYHGMQPDTPQRRSFS